MRRYQKETSWKEGRKELGFLSGPWTSDIIGEKIILESIALPHSNTHISLSRFCWFLPISTAKNEIEGQGTAFEKFRGNL